MKGSPVALALAVGLTVLWPDGARAAQVAIVSAAEKDCAETYGEGGRADKAAITRERVCVQEIEETVTRLSAELETVGFSVIALPRSFDSDLDPANMGLDPLPVGVFSVTQTQGGPAIEVALTDRSTQEVLRFTLRAPAGGAGRAPALLAVRALELLRANALVLDIPTMPPPAPLAEPPAQPAVTVRVEPPPVRVPAPLPPWRWSLGASPALFYGFDGIGPAIAPFASVAVMAERGLGARMIGAGPSFGPNLRGRDGSVSVREALVALTLDFRIQSTPYLTFLLSMGAGGHHLKVRGKARAPFVAETQRLRSALAVAGGSAFLRMLPRLYLTVDVLAYATLSRPVVHVAEESVGSISRPSTLTALGLRVEL